MTLALAELLGIVKKAENKAKSATFMKPGRVTVENIIQSPRTYPL